MNQELVFAGVNRAGEECNECWIRHTDNQGWKKLSCKNSKDAAQGEGYSVTSKGIELQFTKGNKVTRVLDLNERTWVNLSTKNNEKMVQATSALDDNNQVLLSPVNTTAL